MKTLLVALGIFAAGLMVAVPPAQAVPFSPVSFNLTSNHCTVPADCGAPGTIFGTVTLTQNGTSVGFNVSLNSPYAFANTSAVDNQAFKFNAIGVVVGDITVTQNNPGQTLAADAAAVPGGFNGDGTGPFSFGIACSTCGGGLSDGFTTPILFSVANSLISDFTAPNVPNGIVFVADIGNTTNGNTGPIDNSGGTGGGGGQSQVPGPISLVLMGVGLAVFAVARRGFRHLG